MLFILVTGVPGVIIGASLILRIEDRVAEVALGLLTLGLGVYSVLKKSLGQFSDLKNRHLQGYLVVAVSCFSSVYSMAL